jgi:predicted AlkP superfamily phosphohydrolase/phosphomutase
MSDGVMPFLREFSARGVSGRLRSTPHPLTAPAWTSLMTGRTPGNHGVFDFVSFDLLSQPERALLWHLGASPDGLTSAGIHAAQAAEIGLGPADVGEVLERLIARTLVQEESLNGEKRYRVTGSLSIPSYTLATSAHVQSETLWSIVSRQGRRVTVLNFPCTFPPAEINGFVFAGYVPWSYLARAVHPRGLYTRLKEHLQLNARELAIEWDFERKAVQGLPEDELATWVEFHTVRERHWFEIARYLMQEEPCELTAILFDGVDRLQHLCYHLLDPGLASRASSPHAQQVRDLCLNYFRQLDGFLEQLVALAGSEARVFIASDHGFTLAGDSIFYPNVWLEQHGYLAWADGAPIDEQGRLALDSHTETTTLFDWARTTAFALTASSNGIFIRRAEFPGAPGVTAEDYPAFRERLITSLLATTDPATGQPVVEQVLTREGAFPGQHTEKAPDLTLVLRDHGFLSILRAAAPVLPRHAPYGTHHPDGVFMASGEGIDCGRSLPPAAIVDVAPTLLYSLGLPVPSDLEGTAVTSAFAPSFIAGHPIRIESPQAFTVPEAGPAMDQAAEERVLSRLQLLGY